jgi:hypothetical protein
MSEGVHKRIVIDFEECAEPPCYVYVPYSRDSQNIQNGEIYGLIFKAKIAFHYCAYHTREGR